MIEILKDIFTSPAGSFGSMFAIFGLLFWLAFKAGKMIKKHQVIDVIQSNIDKIKEDISEIKAYMKVHRRNNEPFAKTKSPISLTEKGNTISIDLRVESIIDKEWDKLNKEIKNKLRNKNNPYDVQEICFHIGSTYSKFISDNDFDFIKKYAFKQGYNLFDFDIIFGVYIRDKYFLENDINVRGIDTHEPTKK